MRLLSSRLVDEIQTDTPVINFHFRMNKYGNLVFNTLCAIELRKAYEKSVKSYLIGKIKNVNSIGTPTRGDSFYVNNPQTFTYKLLSQ